MQEKKVAFFSRVSTNLQHSSIENQQKIFEQWLQKNTDCIFYKIYEDEGISGAKAYKRVNWLQMLKDGRNGLFNVIVCKSFSRFGRNIVETLGAIKELRAKGIRCVFLEDGLDSEKDMSKFGLFSWLAEEEANKTSERIKQVWDSYNSEGKVHVTIAPYGYNYNKDIKNFVINEVEAKVVRNIFNMYLNGYGVNKIAKLLIENNIPTKKGGKWAGATIRTMLTNEFYVGTLVQGKSRTLDATMKENMKIPKENWYKHLNNHEAIIDKEAFKKVNKQIEERSYRAKNSYTKSNVYTNISFNNSKERNSNKSLFSNLLVCGECGRRMTVKRKKKEMYKPFYQCLEYDRISLECGHSSNRINEEVLIDLLKEELLNFSGDNLKRLNEINIIKKNNIDSDNKKIEKELESIDRKIKKQINIANILFEKYSEGNISELQLSLQNESIQKALNSFIAQKKELNDKLHFDYEKNKIHEIYEGVEAVLDKKIEKWTNAELKEVIEKIVIFIDGTIRMEIKYIK